MQKVSCRTLGVVLKAAKRRRLADSVLLEGVDYDRAYLSNAKNRIGWEVFCQILRNARNAWTLEELSDLNESFMRSAFAYVGVVARLLFTSRDLFDWILKRGVGGGPQLFSDCIVATYEHVGADTTIIRLEIQPNYEPSPEFFWMTRGAFIAMPRAVGAGSATVTMTIEGRLGVFRVKYRNKRGTLSSLIRLLSWPFTARTAARELKRTNEELQERFEQLQDARATLDRQATQLRTAYTINELAQRVLELEAALETIAKALVEQANFAWAELELGDHSRVARAGIRNAPPVLERTLAGREGQIIAHLRVTPARDADRAEREELLDFLVPGLSIAVENAIYRTDLERLVDARTIELRDARDALSATVDQLREAHGARERFFGNISHEIRTPLSIIMLATSDLEARAGNALDARARSRFAIITDTTRKLVRLVDELLLLAAGQEGKLTTHPEPTDLAALVRLLETAWRPIAERAGHTLVTRIPEALHANIDPVAIERVATNLLSNAVKYTPAGGTLELELSQREAGIRLSVFDTGPGIDGELAARLFGRFERGTHRGIGGTGIGLSLAKQLVEAHQGSIVAVKRVGPGTELRVELPAERVLADRTSVVPATRLRLVDDPVETSNAIGDGTRLAPTGLSRGTVLLAEDDARLAEMIASLLADEFTVVVAHDGNSALELMRRHEPQLLVTDVDMPGLDGIELSRRFREHTGDRLAPIIILSAMLDLGTRVAGLEAGATDYVSKPFDPIELKARVRAQFRMRDLALRLHRAEQLSALGILTAGLAHELRNPANGIINALPPLRERLPAELLAPEHPVNQLFEVVGECADQINQLAKQLLGFREDGITLETRPIAVRALVDRALSLTRDAFEGVELKTSLTSSAFSCAPPLMLQVLINLLENAAYAAGKGGRVDLAARDEGDKLVIEVSDSGGGVPVELRERVFEPFFTTKPVGVGTGLGLSLARDIVQRHRGTLEIRERGERAAFVIELPARRAGDVAAAV
jgi:signal transduction histidine kinase